jgi:hypothetical protein
VLGTLSLTPHSHMARVTTAYWNQVGAWALELFAYDRVTINKSPDLRIRTLQDDIVHYLRQQGETVELKKETDKRYIIFYLKKD